MARDLASDLTMHNDMKGTYRQGKEMVPRGLWGVNAQPWALARENMGVGQTERWESNCMASSPGSTIVGPRDSGNLLNISELLTPRL